MDGLTVRFLENEYYDIEQDIDVVRLMAVTPMGTWSGITPSSQAKVRRKEFKDYVLEQMYSGAEPCEVEFG